jgi:hypothetical protein
MRVGAQTPATLAANRGGVEVNHLCARVYAGIGPACANDVHSRVSDARQRKLDDILNSWKASLELPASVLTAVVLEAGREPRHLEA